MKKAIIAGLLTTVALLGSPAEAALLTYTNQAAFLSATGAVNAMPGGYPNFGSATPASLTVGSLTFTAAPGSSLVSGNAGLAITDWTTLLPGYQLAVSGVENINVASGLVFSMGFDFVEPSISGSTTDTCNTTCVDSTFTATLFNGALPVGSFIFQAPDDVAAFVGVWSSTAFNRLEIREIVGTNDNEYFGTFYTGCCRLIDVPEPASLGLLGSGLLALYFGARRRKQV